MIRAHSDVLLLVHVVFATRHRQPRLPQTLDRWLHDELRQQAVRNGAEVLGVGNANDHVHVVLSLHPAIALAEVVRHLKGATSRAWNLERPARRLRWQSGYWARSADTAALPNLLSYLAGQRERHASGAIDACLEQTPATVPREDEVPEVDIADGWPDVPTG